MTTTTFNKKIILNSVSAECLINKIEYDKNNQPKFLKIDVQQELKDSVKSLKQLLYRYQ